MTNELNLKTVSELEDLVCRLELRRERIDHGLAELKRERQQAADELNRAAQALAKRKAQDGARSAPAVSAHALLRYVERVLGIDTALIEGEILSPANRAAIKAGATRITTGGVTFVIRDGVVVTVVE